MSHQGQLAFDLAEASFQDRLNLVNLSLQRIEADIYLCRLMERVFYLTHGGQEGETVVKTYEELAARPLWLCCSRSKARSTVGLARHCGLLTVTENRYATGGQQANGYAVDWEGVRRILHGGRSGSQDRSRRGERRAEHGGPGASTGHPHALIKHPPVTTEHRGALLRQPSLDNHSSIFSESSSPVPDPDPEARNREVGYELPEELAIVPELREAAGRVVAKRPLGSLAYGAFAKFQERHLANANTLLEWHGRQLSLPDPVLGPTLAEAILCVAAGLYAARLPAQEIRKSRVAVFVHTVAKGDWRRVLRYVPEAARQVDAITGEAVSLEDTP